MQSRAKNQTPIHSSSTSFIDEFVIKTIIELIPVITRINSFHYQFRLTTIKLEHSDLK
jgi:hypothetical protein